MKTINKIKIQSAKWKNIFANDMTDRGLISKIYKQLIQVNVIHTQKKNNTINNGQKTGIDIFLIKTHRWLKGS